MCTETDDQHAMLCAYTLLVHQLSSFLYDLQAVLYAYAASQHQCGVLAHTVADHSI